jgi:nitrite reductase (NADH) small subunit
MSFAVKTLSQVTKGRHLSLITHHSSRSCAKQAMPDTFLFLIDSVRSRMNEWIKVCRLDDIVPNTGVCALVGGEQVAVFRVDDGSLYAIGNHDPFSHANVLSRGIVGDLKGELVVASPVYKQHFSLATGQCLEDPELRVAVFPVRLDNGEVWVSPRKKGSEV